MEFYCIDVFNSEIENGLRDKDDALFEHVEPPWLSFDVSLETRLVLF